MAQYFFKMSQAEKNNILDQHKSLYDGYVTEYAKESNTQPLYVQDLANDKNGITVSNKGEVKHYTNMNINEDIDRRDQIGDGPDDLENGTVDLENPDFMHDLYPSPNEDEIDYISLGSGCKHCDDDNLDIVVDIDPMEEMTEDFYEYDIDELDDFSSEPLNEFDEEEYYEECPVCGGEGCQACDGKGEIPLRDDENLMESVNKSLDMFRRFKNYN